MGTIENLRRLAGREANPESLQVEALIEEYRATVQRLLGNRNYRSFQIEQRPTEEDFPDVNGVWPYYRDLFSPINVRVERYDTAVQVDTGALGVRLEPRGAGIRFLQRFELPYMRPTCYYEKDGWDKRKAWAQVGVNLVGFVEKHSPISSAIASR